MNKHYGIPYMGSKEKILYLFDYIAEREHGKKYFIDPFCGGFSVSAYMLEKYKFRVLANDLNKYIIALYREMFYNHSQEIKKVWHEWVDRERFADVKNHPENYPDWYVGYVLTIWSFGNRQSAYLFGKDIERIKKEAHEYLLANGYIENPALRIKLVKQFKEHAKLTGRFELERLQQLQQLERLQQLEQLEQLERLQQLEHGDWCNFIQSIPENVLKQSFIYCDPPYESTATYHANEMDYEKFWEWFRKFPYPIYVSSYAAPEDIKPIHFTKKYVLLSAQKERKKSVENIYYNGNGIHTPTMYDLLFNQPTKK